MRFPGEPTYRYVMYKFLFTFGLSGIQPYVDSIYRVCAHHCGADGSPTERFWSVHSFGRYERWLRRLD